MIPIQSLEKPGHLYHATPLWRVEFLLEGGLRADCGRNSYKGQPYQCLTPSIHVAIDMAKIAHDEAFRRTGCYIMGVLGFDRKKLPHPVVKQLDDDPKMKGGIITYLNLPPESISQVIVANLRDDRSDIGIRHLCEQHPSLLSYQQIQYVANDGLFRNL